MTASPYLRPADAAEYCRVTRRQIYLWVNDGKLPLYKQGRRTYFKRPELDALMESELKQVSAGGLSVGPKSRRSAEALN
jgi:excisionase family DNA binding protein